MNKGPIARNKPRTQDGAAAPASGELMFVIELWDLTRTRPERVIGRAESVDVASAIYAAAVRELPLRLIVLRRGPEVLYSTD